MNTSVLKILQICCLTDNSIDYNLTVTYNKLKILLIYKNTAFGEIGINNTGIR
jgi:hypothetical protein